MTRKFMPSLVQTLRLLLHRRSGNSGFTLIEVLIASAIGSVMISSLLWLVVQLVSSDRREAALAESDREIQLALDYITRDLREAVYVYDGSCANPDGGGGTCESYIDYLPASLNNPPTVADDKDYSIPILAFWKTQSGEDLGIPELEDSIQSLTDADGNKKKECADFAHGKDPDSKETTAAQECEDLLLQRTAYSLIVYVQKSRSDDWSGESHIARYELKKYRNDPVMDSSLDLSETLKRNEGYVDPAVTGVFRSWPLNNAGINCQLNPVGCQMRGYDLSKDPPEIKIPNLQVHKPIPLIDFVAHPNRKYDPIMETSSLVAITDTDPNLTELCPDNNYVHTPRTDDNDTDVGEEAVQSRNFYACVRREDSGQFQDIIVYLRGNPNGRSGVQTNVTMPLYQTQITMRGVIDRNPQ